MPAFPAPIPFLLINGTPGNDTLVGTADGDEIFGLAGADRIEGLGGNDRIDGGDGLDDLDGGIGEDTLVYSSSLQGWTINLQVGNASNGIITERAVAFENVNGSAQDDLILGSTGDNSLIGNAGNDRIEGNAGNDDVTGGAGDDLLLGGDGIDRFDGGTGVDTASFEDQGGFIIIDLTVGLTWNGSVQERLFNIENAVGTAGADSLFGSAADNRLDGGTGGADRFVGAAGNDTITWARNARPVTIDLNIGQTFDGVDLDTFAEVEFVIASRFDDRVFGSSSAPNNIDGGPAGADQMFGGGLFDTVSWASSERGVTVDFSLGQAFDGVSLDRFQGFEAGEGSGLADRFFGATGTDRFNAGAGDDYLFGSLGDDLLSGGEGNDLLNGDGGGDTLDGGPGNDTATYVTAIAGTNIRLAGPAFDGSRTDTLIGIENIVGSAFNDNILGNNSANILDGGTGGADVLDGSGGIDTVSFVNAPRGLNIDVLARFADDGVARDSIRNFEIYVGSRFNDTILGGTGADTIDGGPGGVDTLDGNSGIDMLSYESSATRVVIDLTAGLTFDTLVNDSIRNFENARGTAFDDKLFGNALANRLEGGAGTDRLLGEIGNDILDGGSGGDDLNGGPGEDVFVARRGETQGDEIEDFLGNGIAAGDRLQLVGWAAGSTVTLVDAATATWRITDSASNFSETLRIVGDFDPATDLFFG